MSFMTVEDLHIRLAEFHLDGISFDLEAGDYLAIIGPTGAGKTILLESIIGFWKIEQGNIMLDGVDITTVLPENRQIGIVYQDYALFPHFTVFQNIAYGLKKKDKTGLDERVKRMAAALQIDHLLHRKPTTLSGGEQQRAALARALIVEPKLLLMDEPFSALDPGTRRATRLLLKEAVSRNQTTVIHITHDLEDAWSLANKTAFFREGTLLQFGLQEDLFYRPCSRFIADFVGASIFEGEVVENTDDSSIIDFGYFRLSTLDMVETGKQVRVAIRPEDIVIATSPPPSDLSAQNVLNTQLESFMDEGRTCLLDLQINGTSICALLGKSTASRMNLTVGDTLYAIIKSANVRVV